MLISGSCHCRNISFVLDWTPDPTEIAARACTCSFCTRQGGVWTSCPTGSLRVSVQDPALASSYAFGTRTAEFHVCSRCGVVPVATSRIEGRLFAVVNVRSFDDVASLRIREAPSSLDEESEQARLARRSRNWIANVEFTGR
jgi:hypothetical protein